MPPAAIMVSRLARPVPLLRASYLRVCYKQLPQYKREISSIPIAPSFPDDFESSPLASDLTEKNKTPEKNKSKWDETQATSSEAAVKADRDDVKRNNQSQAKDKSDIDSMENREPELDEM